MTSNVSATPVGVIGLGLLGSALAERLLGAGMTTYVYNRSREKAAALEQQGAIWSDNPFVQCPRVVVCLYTTDIVNQVLGSMRSAMQAGQTIIDTTTGNPDETAELGGRLAELKIDYLESPIVASSEQTRQGKAMALVAGSEEAFANCQDIFAAIAPSAHFVGPWGNAAKMKLVNNLILGLNRAVLAEGLCFAKAVGLSPGTTLEVLRQGNAYSGVMDTKGRKMIEGDYSTQAKLSQHAKDVRLMLEQAEQHGRDIPFTRLHLQLLEQAEAAGLGELDNAAIFRLMETAVGPSCDS